METFPIIALSLIVFVSVAVMALVGVFAGIQIWGAASFGWSSLARTYRFRGPFQGQVWRLRDCQLVRMRWSGFEKSLNICFPFLPRDVPDERFGSEANELKVGVAPEGLYLAAPGPLRIWHPPLLIPWSDIAVSAEKIHWINYLTNLRLNIVWRRAANGWIDCLVFRFRQVPGVLLQLREEQTRPLVAAAGSSWPGLMQSQSVPIPP